MVLSTIVVKLVSPAGDISITYLWKSAAAAVPIISVGLVMVASLAGEALPMPTDHVDFSARAHVGASGVSKAARKNAELLRQHMQSAGFSGIATEWWHFDHKSWRDYDLSDEPL